jgi:hypothetical protein
MCLLNIHFIILQFVYLQFEPLCPLRKKCKDNPYSHRPRQITHQQKIIHHQNTKIKRPERINPSEI